MKSANESERARESDGDGKVKFTAEFNVAAAAATIQLGASSLCWPVAACESHWLALPLVTIAVCWRHKRLWQISLLPKQDDDGGDGDEKLTQTDACPLARLVSLSLAHDGHYGCPALSSSPPQPQPPVSILAVVRPAGKQLVEVDDGLRRRLRQLVRRPARPPVVRWFDCRWPLR